MKKALVSALLLSAIFHFNISLAQTETSGRETVYRATPTKVNELQHTKLKVAFDFVKEEMAGEAWIKAAPYFYTQNSLELDAKAMLIHEVALENNGKRTPLKYTYTNDILNITLDKNYQKSQDYTVYISYTARPKLVKPGASAAITDNKGLYFINPQSKEPGKPTQIWTQGETEASSAWFPTIDRPNQKSTQEIFMTVPEKYVSLSNGELKSSVKAANGMRTDHWVMTKKHAPYLFFMGVGDYAVVKDKWRNIPVDYYVEKEFEPVAKQIFGNTPEMLEFFSKKLGYDYPWNKYSQMVARDYVSGAMENTTATLHGESAQQRAGDLVDENVWEDVIAHEIFHHWFGNLVTTESWSNLTVNESFANYSEYLWNEFKYGKDHADYGLMKALQLYHQDPSLTGRDLVRFNYRHKEDMFDMVSYNKGGAILHMLRNYLGDQAFFAGLTKYLKDNEYGTGEAHQVRLALEAVSGKDLNWFFNQWFFGSGHPKLSYSHTYNPVKKEVTVSISQTQNNYFEFPLAIDLFENGKPIRKNVWVEARSKNEFTFPFSSNPEFINLNADGVLLAEIKDVKTPSQLLAQYSTGTDFLSRYSAVDAATALVEKDDTALKILTAALKDSNFRIRMKAVSALNLSKPTHSKAALTAIEKIASNDPKTLVQSSALAALIKTNDRKYLPLFEKQLTSPSNAVKAASFAGIARQDAARAKAMAETLELNKISEDLMPVLLPVIVDNKIEKMMPAISSTAAFYPFIKFQDPTFGNAAEQAFHWIMASDHLQATENLTKILGQAKGQLTQNPQAKMMMQQVLKEGLAKKMQVLKSNPQSPTVHRQIDLLNEVIDSYK